MKLIIDLINESFRNLYREGRRSVADISRKFANRTAQGAYGTDLVRSISVFKTDFASVEFSRNKLRRTSSCK